ncbi:MAG: T9SS type A sorting domain-containing protein [Bacteroidales bacterium]|nr:T9SS type A sorting domain-containing protein [Bacteroidales bacterium]
MKKTILSFLFIFWTLSSFAQLSMPGSPASKYIKQLPAVQAFRLTPPKVLPERPVQRTDQPVPLQAGYTLSAPDSILNQGIWSKTPNGTYVWRMAVRLSGARALNLYFKDFELSPGDKLFIYSPDQKQMLGAFTDQNNGTFFSTGMILGSELIMELNTQNHYKILPFKLINVGNITNTGYKSTAAYGDAGSCEVPVNCPEGNNYQKEKRGVARILLKDGIYLYWCTGSLINDTKNDQTPYFLTANHCGSTSTGSDYAKWIFYFNFESPNCTRPATQPSFQSLTGSKLLASAVDNTSLGSDFKLLLLSNNVPSTYNPYYNGWNVSGTGSSQGVTIHHPEGDIKMISTYTTALVPVNYSSSTPNADGLFWQVHWTQTTDGHGVTEPGSSGSPLFNSQGLIIGTLTGGGAACTSPNEPDFYGRFSKSWDQNGTDSTRQLKYWLDPSGTSITQMPGYDPNIQDVLAYFSSNIQTVPIGGSVQFVDLSTGPVASYHWVFEGGTPSSSTQKDPPPVEYKTSGNYSVSLTVTGGINGQQTTTLNNYISVKPVLYPNPVTDGKIHLLLGTYNQNDISIQVYNMLGQKVNIFSPQFTSNGVDFEIPNDQNGLYVVRLTDKNTTHLYKVMNLHK